MTNEFEGKSLEQDLRVEKELERIKIAENKLIEKYGEYEELKSFIIYLSSMERIFTQFRIFESTPATLKEEIIKAETNLFSQDIALDESTLHSIRDEFTSIHATISHVCEIAEGLLKKFGNNEDCQNFIKTLRDTSLVFIEAHKEHFSINEIQDRICRAQMEILTADGSPEIAILEQIYAEFKTEIGRS